MLETVKTRHDPFLPRCGHYSDAALGPLAEYPGLAAAARQLEHHFKVNFIKPDLLAAKSLGSLYSYPGLRTILTHFVLRPINPSHLDAALSDIGTIVPAADFKDLVAHTASQLLDHTSDFLNGRATHAREKYMPSHFSQKFYILQKHGLTSKSTYQNLAADEEINPIQEFRKDNADKANDSGIDLVFTAA